MLAAAFPAAPGVVRWQRTMYVLGRVALTAGRPVVWWGCRPRMRLRILHQRRARRETTVTQEAQSGLVLSDEAGNYYLLSREVLERARVSEEQKAALQRQLGADVKGYFTPVPIPEGATFLTGQLQLLGFVAQVQHLGIEGGGGIGLNALGR